MTRRVGLLGGTFDPVHNAHVALGHAALAALALDEVRWIPTGQPWQKDRPVTPARHREAMVRLAIAREPRFRLDRIEIERAGPSFTLDTVQALAAAEPGTDWVLVIGQDQYAGLHTWHDWPRLLGLVTLAVANRPGPPREPAPEVQACAHRMLPLPMLDISSTDIRRRVAQGRDIAQLVPPQVARYIDLQGLYRAPAAGGLNPPGS
ncbi:MAG: nicotinate-nucleotide adenylyltransferase [Burkholderiales bacterium]|nr:nicotinate-nucleotide adenylyltransferase [Burkholderiales bacterium]